MSTERHAVDPDEVARRWRSRGFSCEVWVDPPGRCWEDFVHATDELVMVLEGQMEFEVEGHVHHPRPGEELLIPAGARHSARNIGLTTARWLYGYKER
ncbi:MAG: cupin domain-containing protein [Planctomycetota bacterium]|nr:MAG: cupin domain-containing protein [Planctomycetota bacterium]